MREEGDLKSAQLGESVVMPNSAYFHASESSAELLAPLDYSMTEKRNQYLCTLSACVAAVGVGTVVAYTSPVLEERDDLSTFQKSWVAAIMHIGSFAGSCCGGFLNFRFGKRRSLILIMVPFLLGNFCLISAVNVEMMYLGRFLNGYAAGVICVTCPTYLAEFSEPSIRGRLGACFNASGCLGALLANVAGIWLSWRWMGVFLCACPLLTVLGMLTVAAESPTDLLLQALRVEAEGDKASAEAKRKQALENLVWLRGGTHDCLRELAKIEDAALRAHQPSASGDRVRIWHVVRDPRFFRPLVVGFGLMFGQQFSGISAVIAYTNTIFASTGSSFSNYAATVVVLAVQFAVGIFAAGVVDRFGRKPLLYASGLLECVSLAALGSYFFLQNGSSGSGDAGSEPEPGLFGLLPVASLVTYIVAFSLGFGPLPWLLMGEMFEERTRPAAASLVTASACLGGFVVTIGFLDLVEAIDSYGTFWLFAVVSGLGVPFTFFLVPETKGKPLDEIQKFFVD